MRKSMLLASTIVLAIIGSTNAFGLELTGGDLSSEERFLQKNKNLGIEIVSDGSYKISHVDGMVEFYSFGLDGLRSDLARFNGKIEKAKNARAVDHDAIASWTQHVVEMSSALSATKTVVSGTSCGLFAYEFIAAYGYGTGGAHTLARTEAEFTAWGLGPPPPWPYVKVRAGALARGYSPPNADVEVGDQDEGQDAFAEAKAYCPGGRCGFRETGHSVYAYSSGPESAPCDYVGYYTESQTSS